MATQKGRKRSAAKPNVDYRAKFRDGMVPRSTLDKYLKPVDLNGYTAPTGQYSPPEFAPIQLAPHPPRNLPKLPPRSKADNAADTHDAIRRVENTKDAYARKDPGALRPVKGMFGPIPEPINMSAKNQNLTVAYKGSHVRGPGGGPKGLMAIKSGQAPGPAPGSQKGRRRNKPPAANKGPAPLMKAGPGGLKQAMALAKGKKTKREALSEGLASCVFFNQRLTGKSLEESLDVIAEMTPQLQLLAAGMCVQHYMYFAGIRCVHKHPELLLGLLQELKPLLMQSMDETDAEVAQVSWAWHDVDREVFCSQFGDLKIIKHYLAVKDQLNSLGPSGYGALARIEREVLLKVVNDFLEQLAPLAEEVAKAAAEKAEADRKAAEEAEKAAEAAGVGRSAKEGAAKMPKKEAIDPLAERKRQAQLQKEAAAEVAAAEEASRLAAELQQADLAQEQAVREAEARAAEANAAAQAEEAQRIAADKAERDQALREAAEQEVAAAEKEAAEAAAEREAAEAAAAEAAAAATAAGEAEAALDEGQLLEEAEKLEEEGSKEKEAFMQTMAEQAEVTEAEKAAIDAVEKSSVDQAAAASDAAASAEAEAAILDAEGLEKEYRTMQAVMAVEKALMEAKKEAQKAEVAQDPEASAAAQKRVEELEAELAGLKGEAEAVSAEQELVRTDSRQRAREAAAVAEEKNQAAEEARATAEAEAAKAKVEQLEVEAQAQAQVQAEADAAQAQKDAAAAAAAAEAEGAAEAATQGAEAATQEAEAAAPVPAEGEAEPEGEAAVPAAQEADAPVAVAGEADADAGAAEAEKDAAAAAAAAATAAAEAEGAAQEAEAATQEAEAAAAVPAEGEAAVPAAQEAEAPAAVPGEADTDANAGAAEAEQDAAAAAAADEAEGTAEAAAPEAEAAAPGPAEGEAVPEAEAAVPAAQEAEAPDAAPGEAEAEVAAPTAQEPEAAEPAPQETEAAASATDVEAEAAAPAPQEAEATAPAPEEAKAKAVSPPPEESDDESDDESVAQLKPAPSHASSARDIANKAREDMARARNAAKAKAQAEADALAEAEEESAKARGEVVAEAAELGLEADEEHVAALENLFAMKARAASAQALVTTAREERPAALLEFKEARQSRLQAEVPLIKGKGTPDKIESLALAQERQLDAAQAVAIAEEEEVGAEVTLHNAREAVLGAANELRSIAESRRSSAKKAVTDTTEELRAAVRRWTLAEESLCAVYDTPDAAQDVDALKVDIDTAKIELGAAGEAREAALKNLRHWTRQLIKAAEAEVAASDVMVFGTREFHGRSGKLVTEALEEERDDEAAVDDGKKAVAEAQEKLEATKEMSRPLEPAQAKLSAAEAVKDAAKSNLEQSRAAMARAKNYRRIAAKHLAIVLEERARRAELNQEENEEEWEETVTNLRAAVLEQDEAASAHTEAQAALEEAKANAPDSDHTVLTTKATAATQMKQVVDEIVENAKEALQRMDELMAVCEEVKVEAKVRLMSFMPPKEEIMDAADSEDEDEFVPQSADPKENLDIAMKARNAADKALAGSRKSLIEATEAAKASCEELNTTDNYLGTALDELAVLGVSEEDLEEKEEKEETEQELLDRIKFYRDMHEKALAAKQEADKRRQQIVRRLRSEEHAAIRAVKVEKVAAAARFDAAVDAMQDSKLAMEKAEASGKTASRALKEAEAVATEAEAAVEAARAEEGGVPTVEQVEAHRAAEEKVQAAMKEVVDCETTKASARNTRDRENSGLNSAVQSRAKRTKKHRLEAEKVWGAAVAELQKFSEEFDAAKEAVKAAEDELAQAKEAEPEASHHVQEFKLAICYDKKDRCEGIVQAGKHALQRCDEMMTECEDAESEVLEREELMAPRPQKKTAVQVGDEFGAAVGDADASKAAATDALAEAKAQLARFLDYEKTAGRKLQEAEEAHGRQADGDPDRLLDYNQLDADIEAAAAELKEAEDKSAAAALEVLEKEAVAEELGAKADEAQDAHAVYCQEASVEAANLLEDALDAHRASTMALEEAERRLAEAKESKDRKRIEGEAMLLSGVRMTFEETERALRAARIDNDKARSQVAGVLENAYYKADAARLKTEKESTDAVVQLKIATKARDKSVKKYFEAGEALQVAEAESGGALANLCNATLRATEAAKKRSEADVARARERLERAQEALARCEAIKAAALDRVNGAKAVKGRRGSVSEVIPRQRAPVLSGDELAALVKAKEDREEAERRRLEEIEAARLREEAERERIAKEKADKMARLDTERKAMQERLTEEKRIMHERLAAERKRLHEEAAARAERESSKAADMAANRKTAAEAEQETLNARLEALKARRGALADEMQQSEVSLTQEVAKTINATREAMARTTESGEEETVEDGLSRMKARLASERQRMADKIEQRRAELAEAREAKKRERQAAEDAIMDKIRVDNGEAAQLAPKEDARQQMAARLEQERVELQERLAKERERYEVEKARIQAAVSAQQQADAMHTLGLVPTPADISLDAAGAADPAGPDSLPATYGAVPLLVPGQGPSAEVLNFQQLEAERQGRTSGPISTTGLSDMPSSQQLSNPSQALSQLSVALEEQRAEQNKYIAMERQAMRDLLDLERGTMEKRLEEEKAELEKKLHERRAAQAQAQAEKERMEIEISSTLQSFQQQLQQTQQMALSMAAQQQQQMSNSSRATSPGRTAADASMFSSPAPTPYLAPVQEQQVQPVVQVQPQLVPQVMEQPRQEFQPPPSIPQTGNYDDDPPTQEEIMEYAVYLGMDPQADADLLYIAEWALTAPLPEGWTEHLDHDSNEFYYNSVTGVSTYEHPLDEQYRAYYRNLKAQRSNK